MRSGPIFGMIPRWQKLTTKQKRKAVAKSLESKSFFNVPFDICWRFVIQPWSVHGYNTESLRGVSLRLCEALFAWNEGA